MKWIVILLFLSGLCPAQPGIVWERTYFPGHVSWFTDVHETADHGFITAMWRPGSDNFCVARFDSDGNWLWSSGDIWYSQAANWIEELTDGAFIVTGICKETSSSDWSLFIAKLDSSGGSIWSKIYDEPDSWDEGYCVLPLPDGGFAVVGVKDPDSGMDQAWILRTDSQGDTLWTREWGWEYNDEARRVLLVDGALTVLMHGRLESTSYGPHLVRYDLDGNLLWETPVPELYGYHGQDMCRASDFGYVVLTEHAPWIAHTDSTGSTQWMTNPMGINSKWGYMINPTMDGGYIYAGQNQPYQPGRDEYSGMLVKLDSEGTQQWWDFVYESDCDGLFSARQLSSGGYIACGIANGYPSGQGYLIRYEPELGIDEPGCSSAATLSLRPTPFNSILCISYNLSCAGPMMLSVFDLTGRMVEKLESGVRPAGGNTVVWSPGPECPAGCYLVVLDACGERLVARCVKLD